MTLLGYHNFYSLILTERCNYSCSYCSASTRKNSGLRIVESKPNLIADFFSQRKPGLIALSGGEPAMARGMTTLLKGFERHHLALYTNLSVIPKWYLGEKILLLMATFHEEQASAEVFLQNAKRLRELGKRVIVKLIVKPHQKTIDDRLWNECWAAGIPAHFVPLEYTSYFSPEVIHSIPERYLTSCLYNSRFFRPNPSDISSRFCLGGTEGMFEMTSHGRIHRCSTVDGLSEGPSFRHAEFLSEPASCTRNDCTCEWHHWADMARAEENDRWGDFINTGHWRRPALDEFWAFVEKMQWDPAGRVASETRPLFPVHHTGWDFPLAVNRYGEKAKENPSLFPTSMADHIVTRFFDIPLADAQTLSVKFVFPDQTDDVRYVCLIQDEQFREWGRADWPPSSANDLLKIKIGRAPGILRLLIMPYDALPHQVPMRVEIFSDIEPASTGDCSHRYQMINEQKYQIGVLQAQRDELLIKRDEQQGQIAEQQGQIAEQQGQIAEQQGQITELQRQRDELLASRWRKLGRKIGIVKKISGVEVGY